MHLMAFSERVSWNQKEVDTHLMGVHFFLFSN